MRVFADLAFAFAGFDHRHANSVFNAVERLKKLAFGKHRRLSLGDQRLMRIIGVSPIVCVTLLNVLPRGIAEPFGKREAFGGTIAGRRSMFAGADQTGVTFSQDFQAAARGLCDGSAGVC